MQENLAREARRFGMGGFMVFDKNLELVCTATQFLPPGFDEPVKGADRG